MRFAPLSEARRGGGDFTGLFRTRAYGQPRGHGQPYVPGVGQRTRRPRRTYLTQHAHWHEQRRRHAAHQSRKVFGSDANDREDVAVQSKCPPQDLAVRREEPLPGRIAQHRNGIRASRLVRVRIERSPQDGPDAQHGEEIDRHERRLRTLRTGPRVQFDWNTRVERHEAGERVVEALVVQVLWIAEGHPDATVLGPFAEIEQRDRARPPEGAEGTADRPTRRARLPSRDQARG